MNYISGFVNSTDRLVQFGLWASIGAVGVTICLIIYIFFFRIVQLWREAAQQRFHKTWRPLLALCPSHIPDVLPKLSTSHHLSMLSLWNHYYNIIHGDASGNLLILGERIGLPRIARVQLFRTDKRHQLIGLLTLGNMASREDWPLLDRFVHMSDTSTSLVSMRALFQINPHRALHTMLPYLVSRSDYPTAQIATLLQKIPSHEICPQLTLHMMLNLGQGSSHLLRLMESCHCSINRQVFASIIKKQPDDHIVSTALALISDHKALDLILPFTKHDRWHIRVHAATTLGRLATKEHLPLLLALLADREWWVRYRAAQAITGLPFLRTADLIRLLNSIDDRYASDMLKQAMAEQGYE
ncbi:MAG: HEAT repeat domain-containing protein [Gammaproteobacteria bacterium]|nr:HEAT repeat domain-containing protein [Gammaproteobacteria bacterium]